ncbi:MAG: hypothetical protein J0H17_04160 [Rhizobiales bacterium]|nr:hypothetical protein [Hyphomicrobiales bacterium]
MVDAFAVATDALFADQNIAVDAIWRAGGAGPGTAVRVVTRRPDQVIGFGDSRAVLPTLLINVRRSEVAEPASGDTVEFGGDLFEVIAAPVIDSVRLVWTCEGASPA